MPMKEIKIMGYECLRCGNTWVPFRKNIKDDPTMCPKCRSVYWDTVKKYGR